MRFHDINFLKRIKFVRYFYFKWLKSKAKKNEEMEVESRIFFGLKMLLTLKDWVQYNIFIYGQYEPNESKLIKKICTNTTVMFDIGANVGYFSMIAASSNTKNLVFAFEPVKKNFDRARYNFDLNKLSNIKIFKNVVSNNNDVVNINIGNERNWGMSSVVQHDFLSGEKEEVKSIVLDDFIKEQGVKKLDIVKIDVEGFELNVLKGMDNTIKELKPKILIEILDKNLNSNGNSAEDIYSLLWSYGYKSYRILNNQIEEIKIPQSINGLVYFDFH